MQSAVVHKYGLDLAVRHIKYFKSFVFQLKTTQTIQDPNKRQHVIVTQILIWFLHYLTSTRTLIKISLILSDKKLYFVNLKNVTNS